MAAVLQRLGVGGCALAQLVETLRYKVRYPMGSSEFSIDMILPAALWPWG